jgi:hypothetical protein
MATTVTMTQDVSGTHDGLYWPIHGKDAVLSDSLAADVIEADVAEAA